MTDPQLCICQPYLERTEPSKQEKKVGLFPIHTVKTENKQRFSVSFFFFFGVQKEDQLGVPNDPD